MMVVIAVTLITALSNSIRSQAIDNLTNEAKADVQRQILREITSADLRNPMIGERYDRFDKFVQESITSEQTARVKLWARDGTVIYSNDTALVGEKFPDNENLLKALDGKTPIEIEVAEDPENARERFLGTLMEIYTPIVFPGTTEPQGVLEIYRYYEPTAVQIDHQRKEIMLSIAIGFVLLYGALVTTVWRSWRIIVGQREERKRAEEEREKIQFRLRESQKMEAIGRLAGGVAHDFNNVLTAITVGSEMLLGDLSSGDPKRQDVEEIQKAAERATSLTRQLLTFSRRQMVEVKLLDVNFIISDMDKMLRRLIGEDVQLDTMLEPKLNSIKADNGSIEQVIMNIVVNASDAMPDGGKITVRTENVTLNEKDIAFIAEAKPGDFVRLSITDTGTGMDKETMEHIFEPFFTTKAKGQGTGLGLSTVYGIIKQIDGWVNVYSEPGQGTTFRVYIPAFPDSSEDKNELTKESTSLEELHGNGERILLVEDDESIRTVTLRLLTENGYQVLPAESAEEAMTIFDREDGNFQLVLSDVILPGQSGVVLVGQLLTLQPALHIILSSGYADDKAQLSVILEKGYPFIQKPYTTEKLLRSVKENILRTEEKNDN
ncbi:MAG: response regulator [Chloroflexi bacterium]|nr:response regulator [Chloroflexota bacterium]